MGKLRLGGEEALPKAVGGTLSDCTECERMLDCSTIVLLYSSETGLGTSASIAQGL